MVMIVSLVSSSQVVSLANEIVYIKSFGWCLVPTGMIPVRIIKML